MDPLASFPADLRGRFAPVSLIGHGTMGVVFAAQDRKLDRQVAIKIVNPQEVDLEAKRFLREAECLARIVHPQVVRIFDYGLSAGAPYIVMEMLTGCPLSDPVRPPTLTRDQMLALARPLIDGLAWVHEHGFLHRDIKPANIFLRRGTEPVLIDFGLNRRIEEDVRTLLTTTGAIVGTPRYLAPELLHGGGASTSRPNRTDLPAFRTTS
jgi:serine/threonine protein kinase